MPLCGLLRLRMHLCKVYEGNRQNSPLVKYLVLYMLCIDMEDRIPLCRENRMADIDIFLRGIDDDIIYKMDRKPELHFP